MRACKECGIPIKKSKTYCGNECYRKVLSRRGKDPEHLKRLHAKRPKKEVEEKHEESRSNPEQRVVDVNELTAVMKNFRTELLDMIKPHTEFESSVEEIKTILPILKKSDENFKKKGDLFLKAQEDYSHNLANMLEEERDRNSFLGSYFKAAPTIMVYILMAFITGSAVASWLLQSDIADPWTMGSYIGIGLVAGFICAWILKSIPKQQPSQQPIEPQPIQRYDDGYDRRQPIDRRYHERRQPEEELYYPRGNPVDITRSVYDDRRF